jgi:pilus assembly protein Flp/PilA
VEKMNTLKRFLKDERGVAAIEYAIIAAVIAVGLIAVMIAIGGKILNKMTSINDNLTGAGY